MGVPPIKAYLDPSIDDSSRLLGVNFASAGTGILNTIGRIYVSLGVCVFCYDLCVATMLIYRSPFMVYVTVKFLKSRNHLHVHTYMPPIVLKMYAYCGITS